jgi:hypothetical protein
MSAMTLFSYHQSHHSGTIYSLDFYYHFIIFSIYDS